jgi:3-phosphoshikimate 1-carboxyvinyltransferase
LLLIAPLMDNGLIINLTSKPVSMDYIRMTVELMKYFGVNVDVEADSYTVKPQKYNARGITIESDWSSAAYLYGLASLKQNSKISLSGLTQNSIQGDHVISQIMEKFGVQTSFDHSDITITSEDIYPNYFEYDFENYPDLVPVMTVLCAVKKIPFHFSGVGHLRYKESDRLATLKEELLKTGAIIDFDENEIYSVEFKPIPSGNIILNSYNDHRLAMSFALFGSIDHNIELSGIQVVDKSYPTFWDDLINLGFKLKMS